MYRLAPRISAYRSGLGGSVNLGSFRPTGGLMHVSSKERRRTYEERSRRSEKRLHPRLGATCGHLRQNFHLNRVEL